MNLAAPDEYAQERGFTRAVLALLALPALGVLLILPLAWDKQMLFGVALIVMAILLDRASSSTLVTMALVTVSVFSTLRYGYWRVAQTWEGITSSRHVHDWGMVFALLLLFAEFYAFMTLVLGYFQTLRPLGRRPEPLQSKREEWPTVDVFIPTYNEPLAVVRITVMAALGMDYPASKMRVFILDDGRREQFRHFAAAVGAEYITRSDNAHAKAGNINHALGRTSGEFVAIFDSDHIPTRSFLQTTMGCFRRDFSLGLVQTPHHFYSPDPFERNLRQFRKTPNEGELFHRLVQDGNDLWNASFFCGSCAVLRRRALDEIGGIAVETVTEDAHTALRMQCRGWNTAYINLPQAAGLATESLAAHIGQRIRWARGMVQILRQENPLFARGLSFPQRLCYFNATTHFLFAVPRLIFLTMPLVYLLFGIVNIYGYSLAVFAYALPHLALASLTNSRIQGRHRYSFWNEVYEAVLAPYILFPTLLAMVNPRLGKFNVTAKGGVIRSSYFDRRIALPYLVLLALNVAGLIVAGHRYAIDPIHHDTLIINAVWTAYNIVILAVAASVAWERRQQRSQVRVDVRVPLTVVTPEGYRLTGLSTDLSPRGSAAKLDAALRLGRGDAVLVVLENEDSRCELLARVARSSGRRLHLLFPQLTLSQERFLVRLVYSRPAAWLSWRASRPVDRPLRSLLRIVWLALRGLVIVPAGMIAPRAIGSQTPPERRPKRERQPVTAALLLVSLLALAPSRLQAASGIGEGASENAVGPSAVFHEEYAIGAAEGQKPISLRQAGAAQNAFFGVPVTKVISNATLELYYDAPLLPATGASLQLTLNGTRVGVVALRPGTGVQADFTLPTALLSSDNSLSLRLEGSCAACSRAKAPWVTIRSSSRLSLSGMRLPLANDLSLLPIPFFDSAGQRPWSLPVAFSQTPDATTLKAASLVASWFGVFSDFRGVRFPVSVGELPTGNVVAFVLRGSELAANLRLSSRPGALLAIRDNPNDPYGKLLIVAGDSPAELLIAAEALAARRNAFASHADAAYVPKVEIPARREYDAPRWLEDEHPAAIATYTTPEHLKIDGSGLVNIYLRLPPDLFLASSQNVPLLLHYGYAGVMDDSGAALGIRLNGELVDTVPLPAASSWSERSDVIQLPTGKLQPYTNTLTIDFYFGRYRPADGGRQYATVYSDSSLDLRALPHSAVLPRLELFGTAGYPFTAWPDLGRTAVILPEAPTPAEYETLLDLSGFFGAQTGWPAAALSVAEAAQVDTVRDKDLILLGTPASQPLLAQWASNMPMAVTRTGAQLNADEPLLSRLLHPQGPFRERDRDRLARLLASGRPTDVVVEAFVSPFRPDRSVVAIVPGDSSRSDAIASLFMPAARQGPVYGAVSISQDGRFQSFLVGTQTYRAGQVDPYQRLRVFLLENYWLIPLIVVLLALLIGSWMTQSAERVAARRLAAKSI